jgi:hypothetical protein
MRRPKGKRHPVIEGKAFAGSDPATYELKGRESARCASPPEKTPSFGRTAGSFFCRSLEQRF